MAHTELNLEDVKEAGAIRSGIKSQQQRGRLNVVHVIGLPGTGKSWFCIRLAELLYEDFHENKKFPIANVVTDLLGLLKAIRRVKGPNEVIVCEEISTWLSSKRAMSAENVDAGYVWDTIRKKRIIIIGNNPISRDIDKKFLALASMQIQTMALNKTKGVCISKPMRLQTNPDSGKTYRHTMRSNEGHDVHRCWTKAPSEELTKEYESGKDEFMEDLYNRLEDKHQKKLEKNKHEVASKLDIITPIESRRALMRERGWTIREIAEKEGVIVESVRKALIRYDRKLKKFEKLKKGNGERSGVAT